MWITCMWLILFCFATLSRNEYSFANLDSSAFYIRIWLKPWFHDLGTWGNESFATMLQGLANSIFFLDMDWTKLVIWVIKQLQALQNVAFLEWSPYYYEWLGLVVDFFFFVLGNNKPCKRGIFIRFFLFFFVSFFPFLLFLLCFFFFLKYW